MSANDPTIEFIKKQEAPVWALVFTKNDASFEDEEGNIIELTDEQWEHVIRLMDKGFPMDDAWECLNDCVKDAIDATEG